MFDPMLVLPEARMHEFREQVAAARLRRRLRLGTTGRRRSSRMATIRQLLDRPAPVLIAFIGNHEERAA